MAVDGWLSDDDAQDILGVAARRREAGSWTRRTFRPSS